MSWKWSSLSTVPLGQFSFSFQPSLCFFEWIISQKPSLFRENFNLGWWNEKEKSKEKSLNRKQMIKEEKKIFKSEKHFFNEIRDEGDERRKKFPQREIGTLKHFWLKYFLNSQRVTIWAHYSALELRNTVESLETSWILKWEKKKLTKQESRSCDALFCLKIKRKLKFLQDFIHKGLSRFFTRCCSQFNFVKLETLKHSQPLKIKKVFSPHLAVWHRFEWLRWWWLFSVPRLPNEGLRG